MGSSSVSDPAGKPAGRISGGKPPHSKEPRYARRSEAVQMAGLVFVAGLYTLAAVEDMLREAHESAEDTRWSAISFLAGFALFLILSGIFK